ncbi:MAG: (2Fe-2S) ferredoxin domain-containing protein [Firmicutes bacterium]|nr:(2Fe-2S) ferredoxin domain-containing protein [Bacillota bacterium]
MRAERFALGVLCFATTAAGVLLWARMPVLFGGILVGETAFLGWRVPGWGAWLSLWGGGISLGSLLYFGGAAAVPAALAGLALPMIARYALVRPQERVVDGGRVPPYGIHAFVCQGKACQLRGSEFLQEALEAHPAWKARAGVRLTASHCLGRCQDGPLLWMEPEGRLVSQVKVQDITQILRPGGSHEG